MLNNRDRLILTLIELDLLHIFNTGYVIEGDTFEDFIAQWQGLTGIEFEGMNEDMATDLKEIYEGVK